jgi:hypothetical protein
MLATVPTFSNGFNGPSYQRLAPSPRNRTGPQSRFGLPCCQLSEQLRIMLRCLQQCLHSDHLPSTTRIAEYLMKCSTSTRSEPARLKIP